MILIIPSYISPFSSNLLLHLRRTGVELRGFRRPRCLSAGARRRFNDGDAAAAGGGSAETTVAAAEVEGGSYEAKYQGVGCV